MSTFFGIIIRMYFDDHGVPHFHAEYQGEQGSSDFSGRRIAGGMRSKTARKLIREWVRLRAAELQENWELANKLDPLNQISPLE
ncbi:MAG: DUF4160 domain-containing protein [Thermoanaerobaculia bacterium]